MRKLLLSLAFLLGVIGTIFSQNITTIAGTGTAGYSGDGFAATLAELYNPDGLCVDGYGNIYSSQPGSNCIREVNTFNIISTEAGNGVAGFYGDNGPATLAEINTPTDVEVDSKGNLYIADEHNNVIRKVSTTGIISTVAGNNVLGYNGDGGAATSAELDWPAGLVVDSNGNMIIADYKNNCIRMVNTSGIISTIAGIHGSPGYNGDGIAATNAELNFPIGVTVDDTGNVFIADNENNAIRKINTSGIISTVAGNEAYGIGYSGNGGPATLAEMNWPTRVFVLPSGDLFISDWGNGSVRKVTKVTGKISTIAGIGINGYSGDGGPAILAELYHPAGMVVSLRGKIYIDDEFNNRIRTFVDQEEGIDEITENSGISIFPNPSNNTISVKLENLVKQGGVITIFDGTGRIVLLETINNPHNIIAIDISNFINGLYFVKLSSEGKNYVEKFIKE